MSGCSYDMENPFETLGLDLTASEDEINRQWRRLMRQVHPDKPNSDEAQTKVYNEARDKAIAIARVRVELQRARENEKKSQQLRKMIDVIFNECDKLSNDYTDTKYKEKTQNWTPEQLREAEDAVQYGLSDSRTLLEKARTRVEELESALRLETERANQAKAQNEDWEQRCAAQQTEIKRMEQENSLLQEQIRDLRQQNDTKDEVIQAELAQFKQKLSEAEQRLQQTNGQEILLEQKLADTDQRVEASEAKAKEWETKCIVLKEQLDRMIASDQQSESEQKETDIKKRKHRKHFNDEDELVFKDRLTSFLRTHVQLKENAFISTKMIQKSFKSMSHNGPMINDQVFFKHLKNYLYAIFPTATLGEKRFVKGKERGYHGIQLIELAHQEGISSSHGQN
jgi:curved DNA-binding protein CbpA